MKGAKPPEKGGGGRQKRAPGATGIVCQRSFMYSNLLKLEASPALYNHLMDVE